MGIDIDLKSVDSNLNRTNQSIAVNDFSVDNRSRTKSVGKRAAKPPKNHSTEKSKKGKADVITTVKQKTNFNVKKPKSDVKSGTPKVKNSNFNEIHTKQMDQLWIGSVENEVQYYENEIKEHQRDLSKHESKQRERQLSRNNSSREIYIDGSKINSNDVSEFDKNSAR